MTQCSIYQRGDGVDKLICENVGQEVTIAANSIITRQGDDPEYFYVVLAGKLRVFRETADGIRTYLTELGEGDYFGELGLVTGQKRTASVETVGETRLLQISKDEFDQVLDHNPKLARHIINQMASWLVSGDQRLERETVHRAKMRQVSWFDYLLMLGLSLILALVFNLSNDNQIPLVQDWGAPEVKSISLNQALAEYHKKAIVVVDARKSSFFKKEHIKDALSLQVVFFDLMYPMFQFTLEELKIPKDKPILVVGGNFSRRFDIELARKLKAKGYDNAIVLAGDYNAWEHAFPVDKHKAQAPPAAPLGLSGYLEWIPVSIFLFMLIPPVRRSPYLSVFCRLLLGVIFMDFALSKIMRPAVFALNVVDYGLTPAWGVNLWSLFLPWCELLVGMFLVLGIRTRTAATLIGAMNIIFITGLINAIFLELPINCGCVGETGEPVTWWKVLKNAGMLLMCVQIFFYDRIFVLDRGGFVWKESNI
jgi:putative oxidoreductase